MLWHEVCQPGLFQLRHSFAMKSVNLGLLDSFGCLTHARVIDWHKACDHRRSAYKPRTQLYGGRWQAPSNHRRATLFLPQSSAPVSNQAAANAMKTRSGWGGHSACCFRGPSGCGHCPAIQVMNTKGEHSVRLQPRAFARDAPGYSRTSWTRSREEGISSITPAPRQSGVPWRFATALKSTRQEHRLS